MTVSAFAIRIAPEADAGARLQRMTDQGWQVSQPSPQFTAALRGGGEIAAHGDLLIGGIAFLDNREHLEARLEVASADLSDMALVAALRIKEGPGFVEALSGSFAIVVWNSATGELEGYRDHIGSPCCPSSVGP